MNHAHSSAATGFFNSLLEKARNAELLPTYTHFLDIPLLMVIVALGAIRPDTWTQFNVGVIVSLLIAAALTAVIPRLYPWIPKSQKRL